jgi:hypothetical protein
MEDFGGGKGKGKGKASSRVVAKLKALPASALDPTNHSTLAFLTTLAKDRKHDRKLLTAMRAELNTQRRLHAAHNTATLHHLLELHGVPQPPT